MPLTEGQVQIRDLLMGPGTDYDIQDEFNPFTRSVRADQGGPRAWNHGSWSGAEWMREAAVPIRVIVNGAARDTASWLASQQALAAAFAPVADSGEIVGMRFALGGAEYVMFGRPRLVEPEMRHISLGYAYTQAGFVAQDPRIYSGAESTAQTGLPVQSGGLVVPGTVAARGTPPHGLVLTGASGDFASTPDDPALDVTGDVDLRADATLDDWQSGNSQTLVAKYDTGSNQRSYQMFITNGTVFLGWSTDGAGFSSHASTEPVSATDGRLAVRATLDVDGTGGDYIVTFYTANTISGDWIELGSAVVGTGATSIHAGTADLTVGARGDSGTANVASGVIHAAEVRDGIDGTVVANPDFTRQDNDAASFTDIVGRLWSVNGNASISGITPGPGGLLVPFTVDGVLTGGSATLLNAGTTDTALTLRIDGPVIQPTVVVQQPGGDIQRIRFNLSLAAGQWLDIDTATRTALVNGLPQANQRGRAIWDIDPFPLPGNPDGSGATSTLRYLAGSFNETTEITATWRSAFW